MTVTNTVNNTFESRLEIPQHLVNANEINANEGVRIYRRLAQRKALLVSVVTLILLTSFLLDIGLGPARYSIFDIINTLLNSDSVPVAMRAIIWDIRLPIALMAVLAGASLSIAGAEMQTILNNPLASPFTLGISAAAGFGASVALVIGYSFFPWAGGIFFVSANAFVFAILASLLIYALSKMRGASTETMVLLGIALVFSFNSLLSLIQYIATEQALQQVVFWTLGSLLKASWPKIGIIVLVLAAIIPFFLRQVWALTALRLGDEKARSMGINVDRVRLNALIAVSALASVVVAFVGTIGFVGLVGPHVARMLVGEDHRYFLPMSAVTGAALLSVASIVSKSIVPGAIIPVGIITSLVGIPFFLSLILTRKRQSWQ
ncbi:MAG: iron ABC transporter permease [Caldilineaceae bacterium]|nr:iron ABC transporter permease [Caldilineaceae bacterium]